MKHSRQRQARPGGAPHPHPGRLPRRHGLAGVVLKQSREETLYAQSLFSSLGTMSRPRRLIQIRIPERRETQCFVMSVCLERGPGQVLGLFCLWGLTSLCLGCQNPAPHVLLP